MIQDASARFCPFCGKPVAAPDTAFCASCGRALATTQQAPSAAPKSAPSVPPTLPANVTPSPIGYGPAAYAPARPPMMPMDASGYPAQPGKGAPATPAPYGYPGAGMAPAASAAPSIGRMIGIMLGLVGVLLTLMGVRVYITAYLLRLLEASFFGYLVLRAVSPGIAHLVLIVPLCYWLALLRLRAVSLARLILEVLAASVVLVFATTLIADLSVLLFLRGFLFTATRFAATRGLLTGAGLFLGVILPVVVGAGVGVGAALLFMRWGVVSKLSTRTPGRTVLHFTLVLGSFVGFDFLDGLLYYYGIYTANLRGRGAFTPFIVLGMGDIVVQAVFAICVVIVASIWMRQTLRAVPAYHGAVFPSPPLSPSGAPMTSPQQEPAQQTPPGETQA